MSLRAACAICVVRVVASGVTGSRSCGGQNGGQFVEEGQHLVLARRRGAQGVSPVCE
jgi:hypothetical protein